MAGYAKRKRMVIVEGYSNYSDITTMLGDLGVDYHTANCSSNSQLNCLTFEASLPLYERIKKLAGENAILFDRIYH